MRVFVACELADEVRAALRTLVSELEPRLPSARWVPPENVHLTLRFLGETERATVSDIGARLAEEARTSAPFSVTFGGLGAFPDAKRARVLWVGAQDPPAELFALQREVERAVREVGFSPEPKAFRPHLTLARFRRPERGLRALLSSELARRVLGTVPVEQIVCFESRTAPDGASYHALERVRLGRADGGQAREQLV